MWGMWGLHVSFWDGLLAEYNRRRVDADMATSREELVWVLRWAADEIEARRIGPDGSEIAPLTPESLIDDGDEIGTPEAPRSKGAEND